MSGQKLVPSVSVRETRTWKNLEYLLAFAVRAVRAGENARFSTDLFQSHETEQNGAPIPV